MRQKGWSRQCVSNANITQHSPSPNTRQLVRSITHWPASLIFTMHVFSSRIFNQGSKCIYVIVAVSHKNQQKLCDHKDTVMTFQNEYAVFVCLHLHDVIWMNDPITLNRLRLWKGQHTRHLFRRGVVTLRMTSEDWEGGTVIQRPLLIKTGLGLEALFVLPLDRLFKEITWWRLLSVGWSLTCSHIPFFKTIRTRVFRGEIKSIKPLTCHETAVCFSIPMCPDYCSTTPMCPLYSLH